MTRLISHRLTVRFRDCDPLGHVNNAVYLTYLEQARFTLWRAQIGFVARPVSEGGQRGEGSSWRARRSTFARRRGTATSSKCS